MCGKWVTPARTGRTVWVGVFTAIVSLAGVGARAADDPPALALYSYINIAMALDEKPVQEDLNLSAGQIKAVQAVLQRVRNRHSGDDDKLYRAPGTVKDKQKLGSEFARKFAQDTFDALPAVLSAEQIKRLKQILNQAVGSQLIYYREIRAVMKISDEQLSQLKEIQTGLRNELIDQVRGGKLSREKAASQDARNQKLFPPKVLEALSSEQRKILKDDLLGVRLIR